MNINIKTTIENSKNISNLVKQFIDAGNLPDPSTLEVVTEDSVVNFPDFIYNGKIYRCNYDKDTNKITLAS